jgi:threonine dehydrogenase-like Zn-dependent dehydrogenase
MKAAVIHGPCTIKCETIDDPKLKNPNYIILKVTTTAICGSGLHIYSGGIPQLRPVVLGHELWE